MHNRLTQELAVLTQIPHSATARASGSTVSEACDVSRFTNVVAICEIGTLAGSGTINFRWQTHSASASSLTFTTVDSVNLITSTFTSTDNGKIALLEFQVDQNPSAGRYARVLATGATSTWDGSVVVVGKDSVYGPASQFNDAAVVQTVVY